MSVLFSWLGVQDVKAYRNKDPMGGPVSSMIERGNFTHAIIISNWKDRAGVKNTNTSKEALPTEKECKDTVDWLQARSKIKIGYVTADLNDPTNLESVYLESIGAIKDFVSSEDELDISFNLSSGTWAMAVVWAIISKTQYKGNCLSSSHEKGPIKNIIPFDMSADLISEIVKPRNPGLDSVIIEDNEFYQRATFKGAAMLRIHEEAELAGGHSYPVFIVGDIGTEKSVIAKLIHEKSDKKSGQFVRVFCGSSTNIEKMLFGLKETDTLNGKTEDKFTKSFFKKAQGGTIYLEDVDTLNNVAQSLLLENIEKSENILAFKKYDFSKSSEEQRFPRIVVSSKIDLLEAVREKKFSEQLFYKLSAVTIKIPNLSERESDVLSIANSMLDTINIMRGSDTENLTKRFSPSAENFINNHQWRGNLLELEATLKRAALSTRRETITEEDMFRSTITLPQKSQNIDEILNQPLGDELELKDIMTKVAKHYLIRAREQSGGNASIAYKLLGLPNYQTFKNWYNKYVEKDGK